MFQQHERPNSVTGGSGQRGLCPGHPLQPADRCETSGDVARPTHQQRWATNKE